MLKQQKSAYSQELKDISFIGKKFFLLIKKEKEENKPKENKNFILLIAPNSLHISKLLKKKKDQRHQACVFKNHLLHPPGKDKEKLLLFYCMV